jgi:uncharacterized membrane protein
MDTFTTITAATVISLIYIGERFKTGAYLMAAVPFLILLAWRMGEVVYYISTAVLLVVLIQRAFFASDDIRESERDD